MTGQRPQPPRKPQPANSSSPDLPNKPYELIPFPRKPPILQPPAGHDRYFIDHIHGTIKLTLTVKTAVHISTGIVALGTDVGSASALIKTMMQGTERQLTIPGSSLKGVVRSMYETITNSTLAVVTGKYRNMMPSERLPCKDKRKLCPASLLFGALDWQGLVQFSDAKCQKASSVTGFMPSMYRPRPQEGRAYLDGRGKAVGRKFYFHAAKAVDGGQRGVPIQQAGTEYTFTTQIQFMNLTQAQLGTLFIVLGQDEQNPLTLKVGGGKPIGMGTMTITVTSIDQAQNLHDRYRHYAVPVSTQLTKEMLTAFIQACVTTAHKSKLVEEPQLQHLSQILKFPTDRQAPTEPY